MSTTETAHRVKRLEPIGGWYAVMYLDKANGRLRFRGFDGHKGDIGNGMHLADALVTKRAIEDSGRAMWVRVFQCDDIRTDAEERQYIAAVLGDDVGAYIADEREAIAQADRAELRYDQDVRCADEAEMRQRTSIAHLAAQE